jgi:hypothetical protein
VPLLESHHSCEKGQGANVRLFPDRAISRSLACLPRGPLTFRVTPVRTLSQDFAYNRSLQGVAELASGSNLRRLELFENTIFADSIGRTMKMKIWKVITNTGKQADLESGVEKKEIQKPMHISAREFVHWLAPESRIDDNNLLSLFKL